MKLVMTTAALSALLAASLPTASSAFGGVSVSSASSNRVAFGGRHLPSDDARRRASDSSTTALFAESSQITMPALSSTMKEGRVVSWLKSEGDPIEAGEAIMVVESDKADMDVEAFEDGFLAKIMVEEGETAPVGDVVALVAAEEDEIGEVAASAGSGMDVEAFEDGFLAKIVVEEGETADVGAPVGVLVENKADIAAVSAATAAAVAPAAGTSAMPADPSPAAAESAGAASAPDCEFSQIDMPALSSTMKEGKVVSWLKSEGDSIEAGEAIMVVESDKADMDVEAFEDGILAAIITDEGESGAVGAPVALIASDEGDVAALQAYAAALKGGGGAVAAAPAAAAPAPAGGFQYGKYDEYLKQRDGAAAAPAAEAPAAAAPAPAGGFQYGKYDDKLWDNEAKKDVYAAWDPASPRSTLNFNPFETFEGNSPDASGIYPGENRYKDPIRPDMNFAQMTLEREEMEERAANPKPGNTPGCAGCKN
eukprot:CAMPEP_0197464800 /NCGR_PEP_ID=MMETSP1175-20131217/64210_1 /TAXON_ID=1003142 /ORGANISM="Triceratium dubium, Strain CCMP147" /LENGTH=481 /DNA_ID=CAMNT_0043000793 /DNA_START=226 /DNA_END=1671 /DNA_ORIENTATION=-